MQRAIIEPRSYLERPPISWIFSFFDITQSKIKIHKVRQQMAEKWGFEYNLWSAVEAGELTAKKYFEDWNAKVIQSVPKDRLLIYNVQEGWEPLAKFLNVTVSKDTPFPRINDADTVQLVVKGGYWILIVILILLLLSTCKLRRRMFERCLMKTATMIKRRNNITENISCKSKHNDIRYSPLQSNTV